MGEEPQRSEAVVDDDDHDIAPVDNRVLAGGVRLEASRAWGEAGVRAGVEAEGGRLSLVGSDLAGGYFQNDRHYVRIATLCIQKMMKQDAFLQRRERIHDRNHVARRELRHESPMSGRFLRQEQRRLEHLVHVAVGAEQSSGPRVTGGPASLRSRPGGG